MLTRAAHEHEGCSALLEVPGIGVMGATALVAQVNDARHLKNGRELAARQGLVPRHFGTGGKSDSATSVSAATDMSARYSSMGRVRCCEQRSARPIGSRAGLLEVSNRRGPNVAAVAVANKMARIAWVILARGQRYQPQ